ncbi:MAG: hypothetical protein AB1295_04875 [Candidatus Micrarchaeota archaeon]
MHFVNLLLSAALFVSGAYIGFRGYERLKSASASNVHTGSPRAQFPLDSALTRQSCIYSHLVIEYFHNRITPGAVSAPSGWVSAMDLKRKSPFRLGDASFDISGSDIDAKPVQVAGYIERSVGALDDFMRWSAIASANRPLDPAIVSNLLVLPEVKSRLAPHLKKILRITETFIPEDSEVFVLANPPKTQHAAAPAILISTSSGAKALADLTRTANMGIGLGIALIVVAIAIILFF